MCTKPTDDRGGRDDLETTITKIGGLAAVLAEIGKHRDNEAEAYLADILQEHYEAAEDSHATADPAAPYSPARRDPSGVFFAEKNQPKCDLSHRSDHGFMVNVRRTEPAGSDGSLG